MSIEEVLAGLLDPRVRVAATPIDDRAEATLFAEETAAIARAVLKRRREFATGRVLARRLLLDLGFDDAPLLPRADRSPDWPSGAIGSITHTHHLCAAAVARASELLALGIDAEPDTPLAPELERIVLRPDESALAGETSKLVFSAKECAYKAQHTITQAMLDHHDVRIELDRARGIFSAEVLPRFAQLPPKLIGRYAIHEGTILTAMIIEKPR